MSLHARSTPSRIALPFVFSTIQVVPSQSAATPTVSCGTRSQSLPPIFPARPATGCCPSSPAMIVSSSSSSALCTEGWSPSQSPSPSPAAPRPSVCTTSLRMHPPPSSSPTTPPPQAWIWLLSSPPHGSSPPKSSPSRPTLTGPCLRDPTTLPFCSTPLALPAIPRESSTTIGRSPTRPSSSPTAWSPGSCCPWSPGSPSTTIWASSTAPSCPSSTAVRPPSCSPLPSSPTRCAGSPVWRRTARTTPLRPISATGSSVRRSCDPPTSEPTCPP